MEANRTLGQMSNANFPMDAEGRVYHLGVKRGEVCNRVIFVGDLGRAKLISTMLDQDRPIFECIPPRGFAIFTGRYQGIPVSIIGTGMGVPMTDFCIRELRAIVEGPMTVFRFGTCGSINPAIPVGTIVVASKGSVLITRNPDAFHPDSPKDEPCYRISRPVPADPSLSQHVLNTLRSRMPEGTNVVEGMNASADSFYGSQGRTGTHFDDRNEGILDRLAASHPDLISLEMETFHVMDLARCAHETVHGSGAALVLAQRRSNEFIAMDKKKVLEIEGCKTVLHAVATFPLEESRLMNDSGCVWYESTSATSSM